MPTATGHASIRSGMGEEDTIRGDGNAGGNTKSREATMVPAAASVGRETSDTTHAFAYQRCRG